MGRASGRFEYDPFVPEATLACVLRVHLYLHPSRLIRSRRRNLFTRNDLERSRFRAAADDDHPLIVTVVVPNEVVQISDGKTCRLLHQDNENRPFLVPLQEFLAYHVEDALRVPPVLCNLDPNHVDIAVPPIHHEYFHIWRIVPDRSHVVGPAGMEREGEHGRDPQFENLLVDGLPGLEGRVETDALDEVQHAVGGDKVSLRRNCSRPIGNSIENA